MKIAVIGTGYVGLVTGAGFSDVGMDVVCVDIDENKINTLKRGEVPFYEPGLEDLLRRNSKSGRLSFTTQLAESVAGADVVFLAVGTPMAADGSADLSFLFTAASQVAKAATGPLVLVTKSTVPVGTADRIRTIVKSHSDKDLHVASNPEFLKEGDAVSDFLKPDRIVIGTDDEFARSVLERLYRPFMMREFRIIYMDTRSAELTKYAANGMLATRISFMNEIANLCEKVGANIDAVRQGVATDRRIGSAFLYAGVGYGGSCFPKDVKALISTGQENEVSLGVLKAVDLANQRQRGVLLQKIINHFNGDVAGKTFAIWGLAFKPRTDDMREAPSIPIIEGLLAAGAIVKAYDRAARETARQRFGDRITFAEDEYAAVEGAHALVLVTEWPEFRMPDWADIAVRMKNKAVFDGRNIYERTQLERAGFHYEGIGR